MLLWRVLAALPCQGIDSISDWCSSEWSATASSQSLILSRLAAMSIIAAGCLAGPTAHAAGCSLLPRWAQILHHLRLQGVAWEHAPKCCISICIMDFWPMHSMHQRQAGKLDPPGSEQTVADQPTLCSKTLRLFSSGHALSQNLRKAEVKHVTLRDGSMEMHFSELVAP